MPNGIVSVGDDLWIAQGQVLYRFDPVEGAILARHPLDTLVRDLCTDGKLLYALDYGWTAGKPILAIDPATGGSVRTIVTEANLKNKASGAAGIAWRDGRLWVLEGMQGLVHEVDPQSGAVARSVDCGARWLSGLATDGTRLWTASRTELLRLDPDKAAIDRRVAVNYPVRALAAKGPALYIMEQLVFGHDKEHKSVRLWPKTTHIHKLSLP